MHLPLGPNGLPLANLGNPLFEGNRRFVVTLKNWEDNESLYLDMETLGGPLHIPNRVVECLDRRPLERNTDYLLTYEEAVALSHDPRVSAVELNPTDRKISITRHNWATTSTFSKAFALTGTDKDWGLFRTRAKVNPNNWGGGLYTLNTTTVLSDASGKNVDVVIVDGGLPYPVTLEYAQNPDGTGYPRMVQYNWRNYTFQNYSYETHENGHQAHTSGTVAGNTQGHARDSNIYNLTYNDGIVPVTNFHQRKPVNPLTGFKNPTITNNSWGYSSSITYSDLKSFTSRIHYRGVDYYPVSGSLGTYVWNDADIQSYGIPRLFGNGFPARDSGTDANFIDAAKAGVINVCSAGNSFFHIAKPSSNPNDDYNNYAVYDGNVVYYHRGSSPGSADEAASSNYSLDYSPICVGAAGAVKTGPTSSLTINYVFGLGGGYTGLLSTDYKSEFSNYGPRVDVFAPGECTLSVIDTTSYASGVVNDPRAATLGITDTYNKFGRDAGTSMSCPHVCGVLACVLEKYPRMRQPEIRKWIASVSLPTLGSTTGGAGDGTDAGFLSWSTSSNQNMIFQQGTRVKEAEVGGLYPTPYPIANSSYRRTSGQVWPRTSTLFAYNNKATLSLTSDKMNLTTGESATISLATTNLPNGTLVSYIISARMLISSTLVETNAVSGVATASSFMTGSITGFKTSPNTGNRITTTGSGIGTRTSITNSLLGAASLTASTTPSSGSVDDGYWTLSLPFSITFDGTSYSSVYVGTNGYITFGSGSTAFQSISSSNPIYPKILISAADHSTQRIYYGIEGSSPNRTYRVRVEGSTGYSGTIGSPTKLYEAIFYENTPNQIDIQMGVNNAWGIQGAAYTFLPGDINNDPLTGVFTVDANGAAILPYPLTITTGNSYELYVRTGTFPAASVKIIVNQH